MDLDYFWISYLHDEYFWCFDQPGEYFWFFARWSFLIFWPTRWIIHHLPSGFADNHRAADTGRKSGLLKVAFLEKTISLTKKRCGSCLSRGLIFLQNTLSMEDLSVKRDDILPWWPIFITDDIIFRRIVIFFYQQSFAVCRLKHICFVFAKLGKKIRSFTDKDCLV